MSQNGVTNWVLVDHTATSLYSVIADGNYHATNVGRAEWMSLISNVRLQENCNVEGFNVQCSTSGLQKLITRIGILGNNEDNCDSCDSVLGFGIKMINWMGTKWKWSSGNLQNAEKEQKTFGYIFVQ